MTESSANTMADDDGNLPPVTWVPKMCAALIAAAGFSYHASLLLRRRKKGTVAAIFSFWIGLFFFASAVSAGTAAVLKHTQSERSASRDSNASCVHLSPLLLRTQGARKSL